MESPATATMISETPEWAALQSHFADVRGRHLRDLFAGDPRRASALCAETDGVYLDYSKNRLTAKTIQLLVALAERAGLRQRIDAMFAGRRINVTEQRAVLHVALRAPERESILLDGTDVVQEGHRVRRQMVAFADRLWSDEWKGPPVCRFATSSTSGSAAPISGPAWPAQR